MDTVFSCLEVTAKKRGDFIAISSANSEFTFSEWHETSLLMANKLKMIGLKKGDKIGLALDQSPEVACLLMGCIHIGVVFVPILPRQKRTTIEFIAKECSMSFIFVDESRRRELDGVQGAVIQPFEEFLSTLPKPIGKIESQSLRGGEVAAIIYSSGSTGMPKGIVISQRNLVEGARIVADYTNLSVDDCILSPLSFNFDYGLNQIWQTALTGNRLVIHRFSFAANLLSDVGKFSASVMPVMPVFIANIIDDRLADRLSGFDVSSLRLITTSGGPLSVDQQKALLNIIPTDLMLMYGLTEAFRSSYLPPAEREKRPSSIGKAIPSVRLDVVRTDMSICDPGEHGEIVHYGGCMSLGYFKNLKATQERFVRNAEQGNEMILKTGDIGYKDADGFLYFVSRNDDMIKSRGYRISPTEVEETASQFPCIRNCVAFAVADEELGSVVGLAFTEHDGQSIDELEYKKFLLKNLPPHMMPKHITRLSDIGVTGNQGKFDRRQAIEQARLKISK